MSRKNLPIKFPVGHFTRYLNKKLLNDQLKKTYIERRFYNVIEIDFIFWFLLYKKEIKLAL